MSPVSALFAAFDAPAPTWTDKEVIIAVASVVGTVLTLGFPVVWAVIRWWRAAERKAWLECERLRKENTDLRSKFLSPVPDGDILVQKLQAKLTDAQTHYEALKAEHQNTLAEVAAHRKHIDTLGADLTFMGNELRNHSEALAAAKNRVTKASRKDGHTWSEKVLSNAPDFRPLAAGGRNTPVLSVFNLKGGVGKTTLTANLGAALAGLGYKVLLIDLDLQGSLTNLFFTFPRQQQLDGEGRVIGDFLASSFEAEHPNLLRFSEQVMPGTNSALVATNDSLAYAETNLTIRWMLRDAGTRDPRFLLRRELQLKRITDKFDVVLMDCPPVMNVCCVNALAASDYLIVPVQPSGQATERVPVLLERLKEFRDRINSDLKVMGFAANRTERRGTLTADENSRFTLLRRQCQDTWGQDVAPFYTHVPRSTDFRVAEDEHRPVNRDDDIYPTFEALAREVESRWPSYCRPTRQPAPRVAEAVS